MTNNEIRQFITFLKKNNAYSAYRHNIRTPKFMLSALNKKAKIISTFQTNVKEELISCSFNSSKTKEGFIYWRNMHKMWIKYLINNHLL